MKPALFTLSFLLFAFITDLPIAFSQEPVLDINGDPIFQGGIYFILPVIFAQGGGLLLGFQGNHTCPVAVLQLPTEIRKGLGVKFSIPGTSTGIIFTDTPLDIEFEWNPRCVTSFKWVVVVDDPQWVAVGDKNDPHKQILSGTFKIQKYGLGYKLVFCPTITASPGVCFNIERDDDLNEDEEGRLLILNDDDPYQVQFVNVDDIGRSLA